MTHHSFCWGVPFTRTSGLRDTPIIQQVSVNLGWHLLLQAKKTEIPSRLTTSSLSCFENLIRVVLDLVFKMISGPIVDDRPCSFNVLRKFTAPGLQDATIIVAIVKELMRPCILPGCLEIGRDVYTRLPKFMACKENWAWPRGIIVGYGRILHLSWQNKLK